MNKTSYRMHIITVVSFIIFIVLGIASATTPASTQTTTKELMDRAYENSNNGNYELVIEDCTELIRRNPNDAYAYYLRAWTYAVDLKKNFDIAISDASKAIELSPNNKSHNINIRGWAYLGNGNIVEAIADFERVLQIDSNFQGSIDGLALARQELVKTAVSVPGSTFSAKMRWLAANAESGGYYTIEVPANESIVPMTLSYSGKNNINIILSASKPVTLSLSEGSRMFDIRSGVTLILEKNITLQGSIRVNYEGSLTMNGGKISGSRGSGVYVEGYGASFTNTGSFTMNGGEISGNTAYEDHGGGVTVDGGRFTMNGGTISGNTALSGGGVRGGFTMNGGKISGNTASGYFASCGGGVYVNQDTFTMNGGEISGNTTDNYGGGVFGSWSTFTMSGGTISGNTASSGGGVYIDNSGTPFDNRFTKTGGTISGYTSGDRNSNMAKNSSGVAQPGKGHAVYIEAGSPLIKNTLSGPADNLTYDSSKSPKSSGEWDWDF
jgi:hypothetical protein